MGVIYSSVDAEGYTPGKKWYFDLKRMERF